jgi:hypothetical protein
VRIRLSKAALAVLATVLSPLCAQQPEQPPAPVQLPPAVQVPQPVQTEQPAQTRQSAQQPSDVNPATEATQPQSQPGAQGQELAITQPPVPVPPGPVPAYEIKPAPPTPIAVKKVELGSDNTWDPQWDVLIEENLPSDLLAPDMAGAVRPFCPRFGSLTDVDKRSFWAYLFQALAGAEAGLRPNADVRHSDPSVAVIDKVTHRTARQQGLLQVRYEDATRYGCDFDWEADKHLRVGDPDKTILQPKNNLMCGLRIMENQLVDLHRPLLSNRSYWGTLHPGTAGYRNFAREMANVPVACGARTAHRVKQHAPDVREASAAEPVTSSRGGSE